MDVIGTFVGSGFTALFTAAAVGLGYGTEQCIVGIFNEVVNKGASGGDVVMAAAGALAVGGLTMLASGGTIWMGRNTLESVLDR